MPSRSETSTPRTPDRRSGLLARSTAVIYRFAAKAVANARCSLWDWRNGVETRGEVPVTRLQVDQVRSRMYQPTHPYYLRRVFDSLPLGSRRYDLVDFGSGKGRVLISACAFPFRDVVGVELDPDLHAAAEANIARYRGPRRCQSVRSVHADILEWPIPPTEAVYFAFAPLNGNAMVQLLKRICLSVEQRPRDAFLVYVAPWYSAAVEESGVFRPLSQEQDSTIWRTCWGSRQIVM